MISFAKSVSTKNEGKMANVSSLSKISLKRRLWLAFTFATFFPAAILLNCLISMYAVTAPVIFVVVAAVILGWWFIFDVFKKIIKLDNVSRNTVKSIKPGGEMFGSSSEIERLDAIFHTLSAKVKESVEELKEVSNKTEELNREISQKVDVFSCILQANILFSKGNPASDVFHFLTERLRVILNASCVVSFLKKEETGGYAFFNSGADSGMVIQMMRHKEFDFSVLDSPKIIDKDHPLEGFSFIGEFLASKNILINPLYLKEEVIGYVLVGSSSQDYVFNPEAIEIVELFSRNLSIVWEHERLSRKVEDLEMVDPLTGAYNSKFFFNRLDEEIKRAMAYQRPCGFLVIDLANFEQYRSQLGEMEVEKMIKKIVGLLRSNVRPIDILGRLEDNRIGIILIERNRRQTQYFGVKLRESIANFLSEHWDLPPVLSLAIAETPLNGTNAAELFSAVNEQFRKA
jgi:diguanylate cyclase (GGDEF)-like protein